MTSQLDSGLTAELNNNTVRLFGLNNSFNVLFCEGVEVETVTRVEVSRNSFGVIVADNSLVTEFLESPYAVNRAVVELNTLTYTDRTRTENDDLFLAGIGTFNELFSLIFLIES